MRTNITAEIVFRHREFLQARSSLRLLMSVSRRHRMFRYHLALHRSPLLTPMGRSLVSVGSIAHCGSALKRSYRRTVISHALQACTPPSFLTCTMTVSRLPSFWMSHPAGLPAQSKVGPVLPTDPLSWNPGPARVAQSCLVLAYRQQQHRRPHW